MHDDLSVGAGLVPPAKDGRGEPSPLQYTLPAGADVFPVVIIGGGLAGLTAAAHLAARGIPPLVLEADSQWTGGRIAIGEAERFHYAGREWAFPSEHGIHALWGGYANMRATLERFAPVALRESPDEVWVNRWRREVRAMPAGSGVRHSHLPAPFHYLGLLFSPRFWTTITPLDFLSLPGFLFSIWWALGLDPIRDQIALDGLMLNDFFRGWTPNLRATFTGLGVNLLAAHQDDISLTGMIAALRFYTLLRRDSWRMQFLPDNPHKCVIQPMTAYIEADEQGGAVWRGIEAQSLEPLFSNPTNPTSNAEKPLWRITVQDARRGGKRSLYAEQVILATDAVGAESLLRNSPALAAQVAAMRFPKSVGNLTVRLWFSAAPEVDAPGIAAPGGMLTGDFLPDNYFWLQELYDDFREWHAVTGGSALEVHLYAEDAIWEQTDEVVIIRCADELQRAFPVLRGTFIHGAVRRNSRVHPCFRPPTADMLAVQTAWAGVSACGDWVGYAHPSMWMERSCTTAIAAANRVLMAHGLDNYPVLAPPPPEGLARVLEHLARGSVQLARMFVRGLRRGR